VEAVLKGGADMAHPASHADFEKSPVIWDKYSIGAEIRRQGLSLNKIARDGGMYESACRVGLNGGSRPGAELIAKALGVPFHEMFANITPYDAMIRRENRGNECCNKGKKTKSAGQTVEGN
jgi:lambda repressor-like predicted transcriptional regulator